MSRPTRIAKEPHNHAQPALEIGVVPILITVLVSGLGVLRGAIG